MGMYYRIFYYISFVLLCDLGLFCSLTNNLFLDHVMHLGKVDFILTVTISTMTFVIPCTYFVSHMYDVVEMSSTAITYSWRLCIKSSAKFNIFASPQEMMNCKADGTAGCEGGNEDTHFRQ